MKHAIKKLSSCFHSCETKWKKEKHTAEHSITYSRDKSPIRNRCFNFYPFEMQITSKYEQRLQTEWGNQNFIPTPQVPNSWGQLLQLCFPSPSRNLCLSREVSSSKFKAATPKRSVISHCNPRKLLWKLVVQTFAFLLEHGWDSLVSAARLEPETFAALLTADFSMSDKVSHHCHAQLETVEQAWDCVFLVPLAKGQSALRNDTQRDAFPSYFMPTGRRACTNGDARSGNPSPATTPGGSFRSPSSTSLSTRGWCGPSSRACQWNWKVQWQAYECRKGQ